MRFAKPPRAGAVPTAVTLTLRRSAVRLIVMDTHQPEGVRFLAQKRSDAAVQMIDTTVIRVHQHGACIADNNHQNMGRSRGGLTSKIHAVVDTNGLPVHLALTPGEAHDNRLCSVLLSGLLPQTMLRADRGYDADWIRELARQQGAWANIPPKCNGKDPICFSPFLYRARNLIERFFNKIKQCRRVATRYDKLAAMRAHPSLRDAAYCPVQLPPHVPKSSVAMPASGRELTACGSPATSSVRLRGKQNEQEQ
jgi:transposase